MQRSNLLKIKKQLKDNWGFVLALFLMFVSRSSIADWYHVPTGSMLPTIVEGDRIFVNKMAYRLDLPFTDLSIAEFAQPATGDIVIINSTKADTRLVKRVIGVPGDTVALTQNRLTINGKAIEYTVSQEQYTYGEKLGDVIHPVQFVPVEKALSSFKPVIVPKDHVLVMGDNRNRSADSRVYGFIPIGEIQGKALKVITSLDPNNFYLPRDNRNLKPLI